MNYNSSWNLKHSASSKIISGKSKVIIIITPNRIDIPIAILLNQKEIGLVVK